MSTLLNGGRANTPPTITTASNELAPGHWPSGLTQSGCIRLPSAAHGQKRELRAGQALGQPVLHAVEEHMVADIAQARAAPQGDP